MKKFIKDNKLFLGIALVVILAFVGFNMMQCANNASSNDESNSTPNAKYADMIQADITTQPILYDFSQGALGRSAYFDYTKYSDVYYVITVKSSSLAQDSGAMYISRYEPTEELPSIGSGYFGATYDGDDWSNMVNCFNFWDSSRVKEEGEWKFYILCSSKEPFEDTQAGVDSYTKQLSTHTWLSMTLSGIDFGESVEESYVYANGYPTPWVRDFREHALGGDMVSEELGIDFSDSFWDENQYGQVIDVDGAKYKIVGVGRYAFIPYDDNYSYTSSVITQEELDNFKSGNYTPATPN